MNCFRHPDAEAVVFCRGCNKALCLDCCEQLYDGERHVCSAECAQKVKQQPDADDPPDNIFQQVYAFLFESMLVMVIGGLVGGIGCAMGAQMVGDRLKQHLSPQLYSNSSNYVRHDPHNSPFRFFYDAGITNWKAQFVIGAVIGIAFAIVWVKTSNKIAGAVFVGFVLIMQALAMWTSW